MPSFDRSCYGVVFCVSMVVFFAGCKKQEAQHSDRPPDRPRLTSRVTFRDVTFRSAALNRDMQYRVFLPARVTPGQKLQVVYLLHGRGGGFRDWSNYSDVSRFAESGLVLVMPEGGDSYYTNSVDAPQDRYEDYIVSDLIADVESRFPVATGRGNRAIVGVSMGGFGAVKVGLRHPELYGFVGGISAAVDVPRRPFSFKRLQQSRQYRSIFGPAGSQTRRENDPFILVRSANPATAPYFFLACGEQEGLLPPNREFAGLLEQRHLQYEFHTAPGSHDWNQWNAWLAILFQSLTEHLNRKN